MESDYGRVFLANLQEHPLAVELPTPAPAVTLAVDAEAEAAAQAIAVDVAPPPTSDAATPAGFGEGSPGPVDVGVPAAFATEPWDDDNTGPAPIPKVEKAASPEGRGAPTDDALPERPCAAADGAVSAPHSMQPEPEAERGQSAAGSSCDVVQAGNTSSSIEAPPFGMPTPTVPEREPSGDATQPAEHVQVAIPEQSSSSQPTTEKAPNGSARPLVSGLDLEKAPQAAGPMSPRGARPPPDISLGRSAKPASSGLQIRKETLAEIDAKLVERLDAFFANERLWKLVELKVGEQIKKLETKEHNSTVGAGTRSGGTADQSLSRGGEQSVAGNRPFRVQVPKPYPGVQYRKSKNLEDRYPRYAANGATVLGQIVDNGEWLKIRGNVFLPMRIGAVRILEPLPNPPAKGETEGGASDSFCNCCSGGGHSVASGETLAVQGNDAQPRRT